MFTLYLASSIALSSIGLYSIIFPGSMPLEPAIIIFGLESFIRVANSFGAKPPNTTTCTAPILAHASIDATASGIIGI